jgi:hypothetical protein
MILKKTHQKDLKFCLKVFDLKDFDKDIKRNK